MTEASEGREIRSEGYIWKREIHNPGSNYGAGSCPDLADLNCSKFSPLAVALTCGPEIIIYF